MQVSMPSKEVSMDRIFRDPALEDEFQRQGYVVCPFLDADQLKAVQQLHDDLVSTDVVGFHATVLSESFEHRWRVSEGIKAIVEEKLAQIVPHHKMCLGSFVIKPAASKGGFLPLHQDWWIVDNTVHRAVQFWCPLVDVNTHNACLKVVPGSHRLFNSPYPINSAYRTDYHPVLQTLETEYAVRVPMPAGAALIYDQRLLHGSDENASEQLRVAFNCVTIPRHLQPHIYYCNGRTANSLDVLEVAEDFLCRFQYNAPLEPPYPSGVRYLESIPVTIQPPSAETLATLKPPPEETPPSRRPWQVLLDKLVWRFSR